MEMGYSMWACDVCMFAKCVDMCNLNLSWLLLCTVSTDRSENRFLLASMLLPHVVLLTLSPEGRACDEVNFVKG